MATPFDPERVLGLPLMANLATIDTDGPRNAPVWFLWEGGMLSMLGSRDSSSVQRIEADPRCAVEIVDYDNAEGRLLHLGLRGQATITDMDAELFKRLLRKYLDADEANWNPWFIETVARIDDPDGRLIRLRPDSIFTNNVSYFRTGPKLAT
ncbi:pyridoxamine 5'-phosphate oxidase family protein [Cognatishimia sp. MH4019]|uniref:pyridoxamine 5'-phosphate oxidase family protein n=1 Tax=Cognatishimia sp. MH4019 TaxID=2854030 RepID=UPI001CD41AC3|nr:pyridoxamine 5'-phosphate oxidase family protein [Cognatishimia sp. MH4019]